MLITIMLLMIITKILKNKESTDNSIRSNNESSNHINKNNNKNDNNSKKRNRKNKRSTFTGHLHSLNRKTLDKF